MSAIRAPRDATEPLVLSAQQRFVGTCFNGKQVNRDALAFCNTDDRQHAAVGRKREAQITGGRTRRGELTCRRAHMGRTEIAGPSQVIVPLGQQTGTSTLTAANGDTIVIAFAGTVAFEGPNPSDPVSFQGAWDVIGGTGRFDGARGSGTYSGTAAGPSGELLLTGRLSSPGANK
jgi:hypothetical protein